MNDRIAALPCWIGTPRAEPLPGGLSNEIWKVTDDAGPHVLRFVEDYPFHHVGRARELMANRAAHEAGFAPAVEWASDGVMVTAFVTSRKPANVVGMPKAARLSGAGFGALMALT